MAEQDEPSFSAKQSFGGSIGNVAGRDVVNQHIQGLGRHLTKEERNSLNSKVQELATKFDEPGWKTWKFLHRTIGVDNIENMRIEHRDPANAIVDLILENSYLRAKSPHSNQAADTSDFTNTIRAKDNQIFLLSQANSNLKKILNETTLKPRKPLWIAIVLLFSTSIALGYQLHSANQTSQEVAKKVLTCNSGGKAYALGRTAIFNDKTEQVCASKENGANPEWKQIKPALPQKAPQQKSKRQKSGNIDQQTDSDVDSIDDIN